MDRRLFPTPRRNPSSPGPRPRWVPALAALALVVGWGGMVAYPLLQADALAWTTGVSWHVHCETVVHPFVGPERCVTEVGVLGVLAALAGVVAGASALVALRNGSVRGLDVAVPAAAVAGGVLAIAVLVGIGRNFSGPGEIPFDLAALAFAVAPARALAAARRGGVAARVTAAGASPAPP